MVKTPRCDWCGEDPLYVDYHDLEWGVPVREPVALFERLMLEGMQAGLSWYTVLKKRGHMQRCFFDFDPQRLAHDGGRSLEAWLADPGLIRHRGKLEALVGNARAVLDLGDGFADLIWSFVDHQPRQNRWQSLDQVPSSTKASDAMSKMLKKSGFRFVGPTICYAFMQSAGLVNDHLVSCHRHGPCADLAASWRF